MFFTDLACPVLLPALVVVLLAVGSLALPVFSFASSMLTGLILTYKHASGVVNDQLGQAPTTLCTLGLSISDPDLHSETLSTMTSGEEKEAHRDRQQASTVVYGCFFLPSVP